MGKHKKGRKPDVVRKWTKRIVSMTFKAAGVSVAASPIISAAGETVTDGRFGEFTNRIQRQYGYDPATGAWNPQVTFQKAVLLPAIGVGIIALGAWLVKKI